MIDILNLDTATFECTFGRICPGICCRNGRPPIPPADHARIEAVLPTLLPQLRPEAAAAIRAGGFTSRRHAAGHPMLRVAAGWCVFFNQGCTLHTAGAAENDPARYKPRACALFPLAPHSSGAPHSRTAWKVRQRGYDGEIWDLFCLDPTATTTPAATSLTAEIALANRPDPNLTPAPAPRTTPQ